jgi:hypothetical protein
MFLAIANSISSLIKPYISKITSALAARSDYYENIKGTNNILFDFGVKLLDKASIVLTPTAYSDGSLNTVIPPYAPSYINNIPFVTSEWGSLQEGWSIDEANNKLVAEATWTGINKNATFSGFGDYVGKTVKVSFDAVVTAGSFDIYRPFITSNISESGSYSFTETSVDGRLRFRNRSTDFAGEITNIKFEVIEEADFDFTRGSSATRVNEQGLIESTSSGLPRIDYSSGFGSLLLEPQSTNLVTYSEDFSDSSWGKEGGATIQSNIASSPDGSINASYLKAPVTTNSTVRVTYTFSCASSQTYVGSVFVKKDNVDFIRILSTGATSSTLEAWYDVSNGTLGSSGTPSKADIEDYGNGWYRLSLIINAVNTSSSATFRIQLAKTDGAGIDNFNGTEKNLIWGGQIEQQSYATSYIVSNSGSATTRSADVANNSGNADLINSTEGVLYFEGSALDTTNDFEFGLYGDSVTEQCRMVFQNGIVRAQLYNGAYQTLMSYTFDLTNNSKIAFKFKENDFALWINGTEVVTDNLGTTFSVDTLEKLNLANVGGTVKRMTANVKCVAVFKEALTDAELERLTG